MREVPISIVADMSVLEFDEFWAAVESRSRTHPFNDAGERCAYDDIPLSVSDLVDDPLRSLASAVKRAGGYLKDKAPFSEFRRADFLRRRIARETVECDFERALAFAMSWAQDPQASALPGRQGSSRLMTAPGSREVAPVRQVPEPDAALPGILAVGTSSMPAAPVHMRLKISVPRVVTT